MAVSDALVAELNSAIAQATADKPADVGPTPSTESTSVNAELSTSTGVESDVKSEPVDDATTPAEEPDSSTGEVVETIVSGDTKGKVRPTNTISNESLTRAIRAGLTYEDAKSFVNDASLNRVIASIEAARRPVDKSEEATPSVEADPFAGLPKLDPDVYEADVVKMYDGLVAVIKKQQESIQSLQGRQNIAIQNRQASSAIETENWFDSQVNKLGDDFSESLGSGSTRELSQGSSQYAKRDAIANQVAVLIAGYRVTGVQSPPRDKLFETAARLVLKEEYLQAHEKSLSKDLGKRATQHISRVGHQVSKDRVSAQDAIAAMLDEKYFPKT